MLCQRAGESLCMSSCGVERKPDGVVSTQCAMKSQARGASECNCTTGGMQRTKSAWAGDAENTIGMVALPNAVANVNSHRTAGQTRSHILHSIGICSTAMQHRRSAERCTPMHAETCRAMPPECNGKTSSRNRGNRRNAQQNTRMQRTTIYKRSAAAKAGHWGHKHTVS